MPYIFVSLPFNIRADLSFLDEVILIISIIYFSAVASLFIKSPRPTMKLVFSIVPYMLLRSVMLSLFGALVASAISVLFDALHFEGIDGEVAILLSSTFRIIFALFLLAAASYSYQLSKIVRRRTYYTEEIHTHGHHAEFD